jgi:hypothetical protein
LGSREKGYPVFYVFYFSTHIEEEKALVSRTKLRLLVLDFFKILPCENLKEMATVLELVIVF